MTGAHLLVQAQRDRAERAAVPVPRAEDFPKGHRSVHTALAALLGDPPAAEVLQRHLPGIADTELLQFLGPTPLIDIAAAAGGLLPPEKLGPIAEELGRL
ncbi:hypothetical protein [Streptomyces sp. NPDC057494]|uniref:hypothetical protein n=1 Tax=Streptomyces sp. NPDC057494 TaxID=3346148 RepID=UPI0036A87BE0